MLYGNIAKEMLLKEDIGFALLEQQSMLYEIDLINEASFGETVSKIIEKFKQILKRLKELAFRLFQKINAKISQVQYSIIDKVKSKKGTINCKYFQADMFVFNQLPTIIDNCTDYTKNTFDVINRILHEKDPAKIESLSDGANRQIEKNKELMHLTDEVNKYDVGYNRENPSYNFAYQYLQQVQPAAKTISDFVGEGEKKIAELDKIMVGIEKTFSKIENTITDKEAARERFNLIKSLISTTIEMINKSMTTTSKVGIKWAESLKNMTDAINRAEGGEPQSA